MDYYWLWGTGNYKRDFGIRGGAATEGRAR
jgi:hypothetical protein